MTLFTDLKTDQTAVGRCTRREFGAARLPAVCHPAAPERQSLKCGGQFHRRTKCKSPICPQSCPQGVPALRLTGTGNAHLSCLAASVSAHRSRSPNARTKSRLYRFDCARQMDFGGYENQIDVAEVCAPPTGATAPVRLTSACWTDASNGQSRRRPRVRETGGCQRAQAVGLPLGPEDF